jgi:hypothetical protein
LPETANAGRKTPSRTIFQWFSTLPKALGWHSSDVTKPSSQKLRRKLSNVAVRHPRLACLD